MTIPAAAPFCAVIGAGPAGLAAAGVLARAGARVTLYEHRPSPARKFLFAGRGGLNITHSEALETMLTRYGAAAQALAPHIRAFTPQQVGAFCDALGEDCFIGSSGRVFPKSFKATPLLRAWLQQLAAQGVTIATGCRFEGFAGDRALRLRGPDGAAFTQEADAVVLACGGASWPRLGSDGQWTAALGARGVEIEPLVAANCGVAIAWRAPFLAAFEGAPVKNVSLRHGADTARGDVVVTRSGLEGGPVYALSSALRRAVDAEGAAALHIDLRPDSALAALTEKLARPQGKQSQSTFLRKTLGLAKIDIALLREAAPEGLPRDAAAMAQLVKAAPLRVAGVCGLERAISTAGGVRFSQLTRDLMLKALPGMFVAGEMLDFDAPTGGYLLQAAFSTGVAAGRGAARFMGLAPPD